MQAVVLCHRRHFAMHGLCCVTTGSTIVAVLAEVPSSFPFGAFFPRRGVWILFFPLPKETSMKCDKWLNLPLHVHRVISIDSKQGGNQQRTPLS